MIPTFQETGLFNSPRVSDVEISLRSARVCSLGMSQNFQIEILQRGYTRLGLVWC